MLFNRYECIFVRISKVASTSVLNAFLAKKTENDTGSFDLIHHDISFYKENYPDVFDAYFKFAFVRNPWARIFSQYKYVKNTLKMEIAQHGFESYLLMCDEALNSKAFLFGRNREIFERHMTNQLDWLTIDNKLQVDFIGRYENLEEDFSYVNKQLKNDLILPYDNKSSKKREDYRLAYNDEMIELVGKWHSKDIEYFKYDFKG